MKYEEPRSAAYCKTCWNLYYREKRAASPAAALAAREATRRWRERNREEALARERARDWAKRRAAGVPEKPNYTPEEAKAAKAESKKKYRAKPENWEKEKAQTRAHAREVRLANPAHVRALDRARYARDREKRISQSMAMRAKRAGAPGSHTVAEWKSILRHHDRRCFYCRVALTPKNVSRDHKIPLCKGGSNDARNLVPCCRSCNSKKHDRSVQEFLQSTHSN